MKSKEKRKKEDEEIRKEILKRNKGVCEACGNEGVCWVLSPCPNCNEGKRIKKIGKKLKRI